MDVNPEDIKKKLLQIYPEIEQFGLGLSVSFEEATDAWMATFTKGEHELSTHLEKPDVESCLQGKECYHVGVQLGRFIRNYCEGGEACRL
jgi:hypothetical protein